ncbi:DUF5050 domain-containing protein [Bacteroidales bacterium MB20-C3-3]|nr:DUF5050 domain-containing protein [Bacteroidales bacterium MB20-C3-3]
MIKKIFILLVLLTGISRLALTQNSHAISKPAYVYVNGVQNHVEAFILNGEIFYKIQDIAALFTDLIPRFSYKAEAGQIEIFRNINHTPDGSELFASRPGKYAAAIYASAVIDGGKSIKADVFIIRENYCLSESDLARLLNVGRKPLPHSGYAGVEFATNFVYSPSIGDMKIKEPEEVGNISFNLGRWGIGLEYKGYIFFIHKNAIFRIKSDGTGLKEFKVKAAHSLNGYRERIYFYAYGYTVKSVNLDGEDLRTEICPLYAMNMGLESQEPHSITYFGDMVMVKYNNKLQNGQWTDEIRWYATSGRSEGVIYRINSEKRVIGDFFLDKNYVYFSVNWANRKDINKPGNLSEKESLVERNISQVFKAGDKMYFKGSDDNLMYSMPLGSKSGIKRVSGVTVNRFFVKGNIVIFQKQEGLYTMNLNGSGEKTLISKGVRNFNVAGDWIIFSERENTSLGARVGLISIDGSKTVKLP